MPPVAATAAAVAAYSAATLYTLPFSGFLLLAFYVWLCTSRFLLCLIPRFLLVACTLLNKPAFYFSLSKSRFLKRAPATYFSDAAFGIALPETETV